MTTIPTRPRTRIAVIGILAVSLIWSGMVLGVAFLATPAKFLAPSLALAVALDVGRHTFEVFNWVEIVWSLALVGLVFLRPPGRWVYAMVVVPCAIVTLETVWLLPVLEARVGVIIAGGTPSESDLHVLYIVLDAIKFIALLALGFWSLRHLAQVDRLSSGVPESRGVRTSLNRTGSVPMASNAARARRWDTRSRRR